jgi:hypothetical protein
VHISNNFHDTDWCKEGRKEGSKDAEETWESVSLHHSYQQITGSVTRCKCEGSVLFNTLAFEGTTQRYHQMQSTIS